MIEAEWKVATVEALDRHLKGDLVVTDPKIVAKAVDLVVSNAINSTRTSLWSGLLGKQVMYPHGSGVKFWVRLGDGISMYPIRSERDDAATKIVLDSLTQGGTFFDVGSNTGWFALRAASRYRELGGGHVHAFEPQKVMADLITRSIIENDLQDFVTLHRMALGHEEKSVWMATPDFNSGGSTVRFRETMGSFEVPMMRLDTLNFNMECLDFMKVDIEGSEPLFIAGAENFLAKYRPTILSELHPTKLGRVSNVTREDYVEQMNTLGYRTFAFDSRGDVELIQSSDVKSRANMLDVIFKPIN